MTVHPADLLARQHRAALDRHLHADLFLFVQRAFAELNEDAVFQPVWHVRAMCHALQDVAAGDTRRLLITVPPRHLKTVCTSVALPAFLLGHAPATKILSASYGHELSDTNLGHVRSVMESAFYRRLFPGTQLARAREGELVTTRGGVLKAVSVGGAVTGFGADLIIIDDLMKANEAASPAKRETAKSFVEGSLFTRLNNKSQGRIVAIQQRLHEDDIAANLLAKGSFQHLNLPAIATEDAIIPIGRGRVHHRRQGELLFPEHEPQEELDRMRAEIGAAAFSAQWQQNPVAPGGNRVRWEHWGVYDEAPHIVAFQLRVQSWDTGMTAEPSSDPSAATTWGYLDGRWFLLDVYRARLDYGDLKRQVLARMQRFRADKVIIEKAATGIPLIRELTRGERLHGRVLSYEPKVGKDVRFEVAAAKLEGGRFLLPRAAPWLAAFRNECEAFPNGRHDDQADSFSQFMNWLDLRSGCAALARVQGDGWRG